MNRNLIMGIIAFSIGIMQLIVFIPSLPLEGWHQINYFTAPINIILGMFYIKNI